MAKKRATNVSVVAGLGLVCAQRLVAEVAVGDAVLGLPSHLRGRLASALDAGMVSARSSAVSLGSTLGLREGVEDVLADIVSLDGMGVSGRAAAVWIRTIEQASTRVRAPELVWSGPDVPGVHARHTNRVFDEMIQSAQRSLWVCSYAYFDGAQVFASLAERMDAVPGLAVTLLLNIQRQRADTTSVDALIRRFADQFWSKDWPGTRRPAVYFDPRSLGPERNAVLHAKALVADSETTFITSANLTDAALNRNIELGILLRDRTLALRTESHFRGLIERKLLSPLPSG